MAVLKLSVAVTWQYWE